MFIDDPAKRNEAIRYDWQSLRAPGLAEDFMGRVGETSIIPTEIFLRNKLLGNGRSPEFVDFVLDAAFRGEDGTFDTGGTLETGGNGSDELFGTVGNDFLGGLLGNDTLNGFAGDDRLVGGEGDDELIGEAGDDTLNGGDGADALDGGLGLDLLIGGGGNDILFGGSDGDRLLGGEGGDIVDGGGGDDTLVGGGGRDLIRGSAGADVYSWESLDDFSGLGNAADFLLDYNQADGDTIDLSAIDADPSTEGDNTFAFLGTGAFTGNAGEVRYESDPLGGSRILGDVDGDGTEDFEIRLQNDVAFVAADFVL